MVVLLPFSIIGTSKVACTTELPVRKLPVELLIVTIPFVLTGTTELAGDTLAKEPSL